MKIIKSFLLLSILLLSISCSDDDNSESTILFDMLYSGTYITNLRDTESSYPPTDEDYLMELYSTRGKLKMKGQTIPFTARKYESSKYPDYKFFEIIIKDYNGVGNNAVMVFKITNSTRFEYFGFEADMNNETIRSIISPLIGEYFNLIN